MELRVLCWQARSGFFNEAIASSFGINQFNSFFSIVLIPLEQAQAYVFNIKFQIQVFGFLCPIFGVYFLTNMRNNFSKDKHMAKCHWIPYPTITESYGDIATVGGRSNKLLGLNLFHFRQMLNTYLYCR